MTDTKTEEPTCRSCGAPVKFVRSQYGNWMILDAKPERRVVIEGQVGRVVPTFKDHHATCPRVADWR